MDNRYKKYILVALCGISIETMLHACMITFLNDSSGKVGIFNEQDKTFTCIAKNVRRRFGHQHEQARFVAYIQQPKTKVAVWVPVYSCKQEACGSSGNVILKFSDLQRGSDTHNLFTILKHKPHFSMVKEVLPMIQKTGCPACSTGM